MNSQDKEALEVVLELEGETVTCFLTPREIEEISNGKCFSTPFIKVFTSNSFFFIDDEMYKAKFAEIKSLNALKEHSYSEENANDTEDSNEACGSKGDVKKRKWDPKETKLLVTLRLGKEADFQHPKCKKVKIWNDIADSMKKHKYNHSTEECQQKYRNLLQTFKLNKEKQKKTGESKITWELFELFDSYLGTKSSVIPSDSLLSSNMESEQSSELEATTSVSDCDAVDDKENGSKKPKKGLKMSVSHYLYEKNKRQLEKDRKEELRWNEQLKIKEKEVDAINNLADAIRASADSKK